MVEQAKGLFLDSFVDPSGVRLGKPRETGLTMVMDKGLGLAAFSDLLEVAAPYIDFIKLGFGTSAVYPPSVLNEKIVLAKTYGISIYPGGTFFEVAYVQGKLNEYFGLLNQYGFPMVEISDGSTSLSEKERANAIKMAIDSGLEVITECGKKASGSFLELLEIKETLSRDLECGAKYMIIEGRESGQNVGIYDAAGKANTKLIEAVQASIGDLADSLVWEAPQKQQQATFIQLFGPNISMGNIAPTDIIALEALRRGLRSDTFYLTRENR